MNIKESHDSQLFLGDTHYNGEDYHRKHPEGTRWPRDVPWRFPKGPNVKPTRETTRDTKETNTKIDDFMKKLFLRSNSPCITCLFLFFAGRTNIQKFWTGRPRDVYGTQLLDVPVTKWWDVPRTSVGRRSNMFFKLNSQTH